MKGVIFVQAAQNWVQCVFRRCVSKPTVSRKSSMLIFWFRKGVPPANNGCYIAENGPITHVTLKGHDVHLKKASSPCLMPIRLCDSLLSN
jgi:hypothetical protein